MDNSTVYNIYVFCNIVNVLLTMFLLGPGLLLVILILDRAHQNLQMLHLHTY